MFADDLAFFACHKPGCEMTPRPLLGHRRAETCTCGLDEAKTKCRNLVGKVQQLIDAGPDDSDEIKDTLRDIKRLRLVRTD